MATRTATKTTRETTVTCGKWTARLVGRSLVMSAALNARARDRNYSIEKKLINAGLVIDSRGSTDRSLFMTLKSPRDRQKVLEVLRSGCRVK